MILKHLAPIGVAPGLIPALLAVDATPASLVDLGKGHTLETMLVGHLGVGTDPATDRDEADLKLAVLVVRANHIGERNRLSTGTETGLLKETST